MSTAAKTWCGHEPLDKADRARSRRSDAFLCGREMCKKRWQRRNARPIAPRWPKGFERAEEALVSLIHSGTESPEGALYRLVSAWRRAA
jgi:hypothetical protein